ncbi:MAG TPA: FAD-dependent oxidoreductase [Solirubrobacterales bacterium]
MSPRVAIVGAGVSGLVAARELHRAGHEIAVFEAGDHHGGHVNTVRVETEAGAWDVDTGFIVFNDRNYPNFERLLAELGVASQPSTMSFSVADEAGDFEFSTRPLGLFAKGSHIVDPRFHRMLYELVRFFREARGLVGANGSGPSVESFLSDRGYSRYFVERLIVPQAAAVWSADPAQMESFPASFLAEFLDNHGALQLLGRPRWRSIAGGARRYVEALIEPFADRVHTRTPARSIRRDGGSVSIELDDGSERFDEVVIATHSDQALALLADPSDAEREVLGAIPYKRNEAVLHTDTGLMPRRRAAWASWNFHLTERPTGTTTVTYDMNRLQSLISERRFLVTLNQSARIDPRRVIRSFEYSHPVFTPEGIAAQHRWGELSGARRTHFCGAYWRWGFHEDGVWSALRACERMGALERAREPLVAAPALAA